MNDFTLGEFACPCGECSNKIKQELLQKLQIVRSFLLEPIIVSSGYRCEKYNASVGGSVTSSHLLGLAADIKIPDNFYRYRLLDALIRTKVFMRFGTGDRRTSKVFHIDCDSNKPQNITWGY